MTISIAVAVLCLIAVATVWYLAIRIAVKDDAAREAALRIETANAVQTQRAREDARCVTQAAAQEPVRKHRKKVL